MADFFHHHHPVSPEEFEQIKAKVERTQMESEALVHEVENWIESLDARETYLMATMLINMYGNKAMQAINVGRLNGKLRYKHGIDPRTGEPFGAELLKDGP